MSQRIKIEPDQLQQIGTRFLNCSEQNLTMAQELKSLIDGMGGEWEGNSKERFYASYQDAHQQLQSVSTLLKDVGDELTAIAERFRAADTSS
ncbi:WXG100 family type VII secretion target [Paenibacillus pini]|uniref:ESAT-6-like protein n=1 Tax=Paenibacillus pini JCM 16418 TaxID=1236976 RepID=W7Y9M9_9BACL|nr:WXG100 family type VII secretion target [Paenibacillus pini]GAF07735.1 ESAT-6/Esx family secreted protein EsxA/YukE [Paenibacillus pini JCM 16418]